MAYTHDKEDVAQALMAARRRRAAMRFLLGVRQALGWRVKKAVAFGTQKTEKRLAEAESKTEKKLAELEAKLAGVDAKMDTILALLHKQRGDD